MFALLGSLAGFLTGVAPQVLDYFKDKEDKKHELALLEKQMEFQKLKGELQVQEITQQQDSIQYEKMYSYASSSSVEWVEALSCTVRPILTYSFFILYCVVKFSVFMFFYDKNYEWTAIIANHLWNVEDETIFSAVISFWFGNRAFRKK